MGDVFDITDPTTELTRLTGMILDPGATPGDVLTVQSDGSVEAAPGGGSSAGSATVRGPYSFTYQTAGLNNGVAFYTPAVGDSILDVWVIVDTVFDGTTPQVDVGVFLAGNFGVFGNSVVGTAVNLGLPFSPAAGNWGGTGATGVASTQGSGGNFISASSIQAGAANGYSLVPALVVSNAPLKLVVSQSGQKGGAAIDSTQGAGRVYVVTATPVALP